jgi:hypothetical protein
MKKINLIVAAIWIYVVGTGIVQGYTLPSSELALHFPFPWQILVVMPLIIVAGAFFNKEIPGEFSIGKRVDEKFGNGTYRRFLRTLKPELLFALMSFGIGIVGLIRTNILTGPAGAYSVCIFFISAGISFSIAYYIARKRNVYGDVTISSHYIESYTLADEATFWKEVKLRRNIFFATWVGWLIAGPCLIWSYSHIFPSLDFQVRGFAALATWGAIWIWTSIRIKQLRCFKCGQQAFTTPYFFMRHAKCRNCGITQSEQK